MNELWRIRCHVDIRFPYRIAPEFSILMHMIDESTFLINMVGIEPYSNSFLWSRIVILLGSSIFQADENNEGIYELLAYHRVIPRKVMALSCSGTSFTGFLYGDSKSSSAKTMRLGKRLEKREPWRKLPQNCLAKKLVIIRVGKLNMRTNIEFLADDFCKKRNNRFFAMTAPWTPGQLDRNTTFLTISANRLVNCKDWNNKLAVRTERDWSTKHSLRVEN